MKSQTDRERNNAIGRTTMYDAIVIGAGPAGLQAALTLGRMHRSTLLLDSGEYRNGTVLHMHNMIGADGTAPAQLRATARAELSAYDDVEIRDAAAMSVSGDEDAFVVGISDGSEVEGRRVILATGVADDLPDVPGLQDLWGTLAFSCPFCDGHEHAGRPIAILGAAPRAAHLIGLLGRIVGDITVFPVGEMFADEDIQMLEAKGVRVSTSPVASVEKVDGGVRIRTDDDERVADGIFVAAGSMRQRSPLVAQLDLQMHESGCIEIDEFGRTSIPGVFAAGDLAHRATLPGPMASVLLAAAAGQLAAVGIIQSLLAAEH
ncbi:MULTISPECIES: NAD(P)/FAD-dependent oxidoreductase [Microbacterium]|uniref:NAD(P)/FAD-dependent oxidoreductase n=1 Tax=Microbacterium maritypicum TaxID=33918 RepID=A0AAJ6APK9_MICMQ|nr:MULTISPECIES: NAD(P)/FAD-dependent oxidoreductase [Microbacterium]WEF21817.1 NAD(P)/FAD-dependent oxidoreductase [Microbacterium liquefaciens]